MEMALEFNFVTALRIAQMFLCHACGIAFISNFNRYPKKTNITVLVLVTLGSIAIGYGVVFIYSDIVFALSYLVTMSISIACYFSLSGDGPLKKSFLFSIYINFYTLSWTVAYVVSNLFFDGHFLISGFGQVLIYAGTFFLFGKKIKAYIMRMNFQNNKNWWRLIATSLLFSIMLIHLTVTGNNFWNYDVEDFIFYVIFLGLMSGMYVIIFKTIMYMQTIEEQKVELLQTRIYEKQLYMMREAEDEMRRARHDMRHHNMFLLETLMEGNVDGAVEYLSKFEQAQESSVLVRYCENPTANSIIAIFEKKAKSKGVRFDANIKFPEKSIFHHQDITVLLSNILENALNGASLSEDIDKFIEISIFDKFEKMVIICKNTCKDLVVFNLDGVPQNTKRVGIGSSSIIAITEKYEGQVEFSAKDNVFTCCVIF